jgi:AcrR family transcriptional regulator
MLNDYSIRAKAVRAAFELAEEKGWRALTLPEIAARANLSLAELRSLFGHKGEILSAFQAEVDRAVLAKTGVVHGEPEGSPHDRVLDILMTRFEVMAPFRAALARIVRDLAGRPGQAGELLPTALQSQYWMLAGAGVTAHGLVGGLKVGGLAAIYAQAFRFWLEDDSPGAEKTMALLDRKLTRGEKALSRLTSVCGCFSRLAACACPPRCKSKDSAASGTEADAPEPQASGSA